MIAFTNYDITVNDISLHVTEQGDGPAVLFCHGFPDTSCTWRRQMEAVATAGYRAIAPDMRGYGHSSAPADANVYTPLHTTGDMMGKDDGLKQLYPLTEDQVRIGLPGLVGSVELDGVGHWIQHEASAVVIEHLLRFLRKHSA